MKKMVLAMLLIILGVMAIVRVASPNSASSSTVQTVQLTPEQKKDRAKHGADLLRAVDGAINLRNAMRNPESFRLESVHVKTSGAVCYQYRAQNGFGGTNLEFATLAPGATALNSNASAWNANCAHKQGSDETAQVKSLMEN